MPLGVAIVVGKAAAADPDLGRATAVEVYERIG